MQLEQQGFFLNVIFLMAKSKNFNSIKIADTDNPYVWYSQPEYLDSVDQYIVYLLDSHHLFCEC